MAQRAAILGGGRRGADWAARFVLSGWDVALFDPDATAPDRVLAAIAAARPGLGGGAEGLLEVVPRISAAVAGAVWIGECVAERVDLKRKLYQQVQAHCDAGAIIAAATGRFGATALQSCATRPGQILVAHCGAPTKAGAVVGLDPGRHVGAARQTQARQILRAIGLDPVLNARGPGRATALPGLPGRT